MLRRLSDGDIQRLKAALTPEPPSAGPSWLQEAEHRRLVVHSENRTYKGILRMAYDDGLLLCGTETFEQGKPMMLEGEVFVPREKVLFVQTLRM